VDAGRIKSFMDGRWAHVREQTRAHLKDPLFQPVFGLDTEAYRRRVTQQTQALAATGGPQLGFPKAYGGGGDVGGSVTAFETLAFGDLSLLVKSGVQWGLFGGAILHLGTERHHQRYLKPVMSFELPGCFAMTETGHGSDVQSVRTTATYDPVKDTFVINTPDDDARKDYIGCRSPVAGRSELRPQAGILVDAFGIPDEVLAAPIALGEEQRRQDGKAQTAGAEGIPGFAPPPP
jgi:acyl-CoA oxidase